MTAPNRKLQRIAAGIALLLVAAVSGCAARAEYVYDDEPVYRRERVYSAPPPVVVYRDHGYYHDHPRVYRAPAPRARVGVYSAPLVHRPPPAHRDHHHHDHHDDRHHR